MPAGRLTVTFPAAAGVTVAAHTVPAEDRAVTVPLVTLNSEASKPLTLSLNVAITTKGATTLLVVEESTTVGGVV